VCSWSANVLTLGCVMAATLGAQGFDWIPTYLRPFRIPQLFGVVGVEVGYAHVEDPRAITDGTLVCARYGSGSGAAVALRLGAEWWVQPDASVVGGLCVRWVQSSSHAAGTTAPLVTGEMLRTEYVLSTSRLGIGVQAAAKTRLVGRYGWASVGLEATVYSPGRSTQMERVLEPSWYFFATTPPSKQVQIASSVSSGSDALVLLKASVGYDLSLAVGWYCSPSVEVAVPVTLNAGNYRLWRIGIALPVAFSFP